jgi:3-oxoacyl-[acyl-carrier protein] reductase
MKVELTNKVALVTGAGGHIGQAIAEVLAANNATVIYTDYNAETLQKAVAQIPNARCMVMDVTNEDQVKQVIDRVVAEYGALDILVNNAGVNVGTERCGLEKVEKKIWDWIVGVDLTGLFLVTKHGAQAMIQKGSGRIINISSVLGLVPARLQCAYDAAKAGVVNFTKAAAIELGSHGILVNCIAPGSIMAAGTRKLFYGENGIPTDWGRSLLAHIPLGRPGQCREIADTVLFFAAPESAYITGQVLAVDGGWTAGYIRDF